MSEHNNNNSIDNLSNHSGLLAEDVQDNHHDTVHSAAESFDQASRSSTSPHIDQEQFERNQQQLTDNNLQHEQSEQKYQTEQQTNDYLQQNQLEQQANDYQQQNQLEQQANDYQQQQQHAQQPDYYQQQQHAQQPNYYQQQQHTQQPNYYQQQQYTQQPNYYQQQQYTQQPNYYQQQQHAQQQSYYQQFNPQYGYYSPVVKTNNNALASLVLGICSIAFIWLLPVGLPSAIVALCLGPVALKQIKQRTNEKGRGYAITGIVTSGIALVLSLIIIVSMILVFTIS